MTFDWSTIFLICCLGLATYTTRIAGYLLMSGVEVKGRMKAVLDAVPTSILTAVIAPTVFMQGPAEFIAGCITLLAALRRIPLLAVIAIGMASVAGLRLLLG